MTGTLGLLIRARTKGHVPALKPLIQALLDAGVYLDGATIRTVLASVGETWP
jgi:predicted nucleic acid-binding protein